MKKTFNASRLNAFAFNPDDLVIIGLDTDDGWGHPLYDERIGLPVDEPMVLNIMVHGVLEPVLVRKNGELAEVVDGRQRVRAAREANRRLAAEGKELVLVPAMPRRGDDARMFGVMVSANELRRDDGPLQKATKCARYMDMGRSEEDASIQFGVSVSTIRAWLRLLDCSSGVIEAVEAGRLTATAAGKLAKLPREEQEKALGELTDSPGKPTVAKAAEKARTKSGGPLKPMAPPRSILRKIAAHEDTSVRVSDGFALGLRFALGQVWAHEVEGLQAVLDEVLGR